MESSYSFFDETCGTLYCNSLFPEDVAYVSVVTSDGDFVNISWDKFRDAAEKIKGEEYKFKIMTPMIVLKNGNFFNRVSYKSRVNGEKYYHWNLCRIPDVSVDVNDNIQIEKIHF